MGKELKLFIIALTAALVMLSGCTENGNVDKPDKNGNLSGEDKYIYGNATVETIEIAILESFPLQINVIAKGYLPDGCTEIDRIKKQRDGNYISVLITTKRPGEAICTQALQPFEQTIPLDVLGLKAGLYNVTVNGVNDSFELDVDNAISENNSGTTLEVLPGSLIIVKLNENPSTGYSWSFEITEGLEIKQEAYIADNEGLLGSGGIHEWEIRAVSKGTQHVTAVYKRQWEEETGDEQKFKLNVEVI